MSHICEAILITCEDFRLHQRKDGRNYVANFIKDLKLDCDLVTRAGGVQDLVRSEREGYCDCMLRDSQVSIKLHNARLIILLNHEDCGAYSNMNFSSREEELAQHYSDLKEAKKILKNKYPQAKVELYFAELRPGSYGEFKIKNVKI